MHFIFTEGIMARPLIENLYYSTAFSISQNSEILRIRTNSGCDGDGIGRYVTVVRRIILASGATIIIIFLILPNLSISALTG